MLQPLLARELMVKIPANSRSNSKLPESVDLFLSRPIVKVLLGAKLLKVTPKAIDLMLVQLGGALAREPRQDTISGLGHRPMVAVGRAERH